MIPAGYSSDEDDIDGFLSDDSDIENNELGLKQVARRNEDPQITMQQKLNNMFFGIMNGNLEQVMSLLDEGIDVNIEIRDKWTSLLLAASVGNPVIVRALLSRGADANIHRDKYTALMAVCYCPETTSPTNKCLEVIDLLLENGANANATTRTRKTALMFAASNGREEIVQKMLTCSNKNAEDNQGWNALFWAVNNNKPKIVQLLLNEGFNHNKLDVRGHKPVHYAIIQDFDDITKILKFESNDPPTIQENDLEIDTLFANLSPGERPRFTLDIYNMLYGMKCEKLYKFFAHISLSEFLSLTDSQLVELEIPIPLQRRRILIGLHNFHKHIYKQNSIPVVAEDCIYSTIDVLNAMLSAIRQLIAMEASIRYVTLNFNLEEGQKSFDVKLLKRNLARLKKTAGVLDALTLKWNSGNPSADLITSKVIKPKPLWMKSLVYLSLVSFAVVVILKVKK